MVLCLFVLFVLIIVLSVLRFKYFHVDASGITSSTYRTCIWTNWYIMFYNWIRKLLFRISCYFLYLYVFLFPLNSGLSTEATSNGFYIDETPPSIKVKPQLSRDLGSIREDSIVFRSTIKVTWEVEDKESYIQRQYLSIASHKGGEFNATSTEVNQKASNIKFILICDTAFYIGWFDLWCLTPLSTVTSGRSVLLVEETGVPGESHRPVARHWQTLSHNVVSSTPRNEWGSNSQRYRW
jgi:hypothetical protein